MHIDSVHEGKKDFKCPHCGIGFGRPGHLKRHIQEVHEIEKTFKCEYGCNASFYQKTKLILHMRSVHPEHLDAFNEEKNAIEKAVENGEKPYKCELCDYRASHRNTLKRHVDSGKYFPLN